MEKLPWVLTAILGTGFGMLVAVVFGLRLKITKDKLKDAEAQIKAQAQVSDTYKKEQKKASEIQRKATEADAKLSTAVKGAQTSAEPVKKSISVGNDIVGSFNKSEQL